MIILTRFRISICVLCHDRMDGGRRDMVVIAVEEPLFGAQGPSPADPPVVNNDAQFVPTYNRRAGAATFCQSFIYPMPLTFHQSACIAADYCLATWEANPAGTILIYVLL